MLGPEPDDRLDPPQFEAVVRRAAELQEQSRRALDRADVVRIARELGIEAQHVERAIDEIRSRRKTRDPYHVAAWVVLALGFAFVLLGIWRTLRWAL